MKRGPKVPRETAAKPLTQSAKTAKLQARSRASRKAAATRRRMRAAQIGAA